MKHTMQQALMESLQRHTRLVVSWTVILICVIAQQPLLNAFEAHVINVTAIIDPQRNECRALSASYFANHEGCDEDTPASDWTAAINAYSATKLAGVFAAKTGGEVCALYDRHSCPHTTLERQRCYAQSDVLVLISNIVSARLDPSALIAGADNGTSSFEDLGLDENSTIQEALIVLEKTIKNSNDRRLLRDVEYVADRIYRFYQDGNPLCPDCIYADTDEAGARQTNITITEATADEQESSEQSVEEIRAPEPPSQITPPAQSPTDPRLFAVVINEILLEPKPKSDATHRVSWVELYNRGKEPIDISAFVLYDKSQKVPLVVSDNVNGASTVLAPDTQVVVYDTSHVLSIAAGLTGGSSGTITLFSAPRDNGGIVLDTHTVEAPPNEGRSIARLPNGIGDFFDPLPTEGTENHIIPPPAPISKPAPIVIPAPVVMPTPIIGSSPTAPETNKSPLTKLEPAIPSEELDTPPETP